MFVTAHCDSLITESDILLSSSLFEKKTMAAFHAFSRQGKWLAALSLGASSLARWGVHGGAALDARNGVPQRLYQPKLLLVDS